MGWNCFFFSSSVPLALSWHGSRTELGLRKVCAQLLYSCSYCTTAFMWLEWNLGSSNQGGERNRWNVVEECHILYREDQSKNISQSFSPCAGNGGDRVTVVHIHSSFSLFLYSFVLFLPLWWSSKLDSKLI